MFVLWKFIDFLGLKWKIRKELRSDLNVIMWNIVFLCVWRIVVLVYMDLYRNFSLDLIILRVFLGVNFLKKFLFLFCLWKLKIRLIMSFLKVLKNLKLYCMILRWVKGFGFGLSVGGLLCLFGLLMRMMFVGRLEFFFELYFFMSLV